MKANKFIAIALAALTFMACNKKDEPTQKLTLNKTDIEVAVAADFQLTANMEVTWSSENAAIASVNEKGLVIGVAEGETRIKAAATKTNEVAYCAVKVTKGGVPGGEYKKLIDITDGTLDDWNAVDAAYIYEAKRPDDAAKMGLISVKVYADDYYVFLLVEPDMEEVTDLSWTPFHVYLNTDNSDATGGYNDENSDANCDIMLEGVVFADGAACSYGPGVFKWWGEVGGTGWDYWTDPATAPHTADDNWGAIVPEGQLAECGSQYVDGKIEIQFMRELTPTDAGWSEEEFGIGFDIQQNWSSVGILPQVSPTDDNPNGVAPKLQVKIAKMLK